jgi:hypothetical protein
MNLKEQIERYIPYDEQEERDKEQFLKFMDEFNDVLTRENIFGHISASAFVVNKERTKMLVVYHIINDGWIYPGGHADGEEDRAVRRARQDLLHPDRRRPSPRHPHPLRHLLHREG